MTKKELTLSLVQMELSIVKDKKALQLELNKCFDEYGTITDPSRYDELIKRYEFFNGQQALIGHQINTFGLNKNGKYTQAFLDEEMRQMREQG